MTAKIKNSESLVKYYDKPEALRSGGENRPFNYPRLYQIQAGDWRISYSVEHNRLAILVLEVLTPAGTPSPDPVRQNMAEKLRVKLLALPETTAAAAIGPEELGRKLKVKLLDLTGAAEEPAGKSRIRWMNTPDPQTAPADAGSRAATRQKITLLDLPASAVTAGQAPADPTEERTVTPLDEPTL